MTEKEATIEVVSKEEAFWTEIKENTEQDIEKLEKLLKFQKEILGLTERRLSGEKDK